MTTILLLIILGLIFWSFGSVIFFRLWNLPDWQTIKGFLRGRSQCQHCQHTLHRYDLFPIFSFLSTGWKCRYCAKKLSKRYPTLEIWTVAVFLISFLALWSLSLYNILIIATIWLLFLNALYDLYCYELHISASILAFILSIILNIISWTNPTYFIQSFCLFFGVFMLVYLFARLYIWISQHKPWEGFGFWDVLFAGIIWSIFPLIFNQHLWMLDILQILCVFTIISCICGIILWLILRRKRLIPFIPAMTLWLLALFIGKNFLLTFLHSWLY